MNSGVKLIVASVICALAPPFLEMISDGGPSKFGSPETGYVMAMFGFVLWPLALILFLIGFKRVIFDYYQNEVIEPPHETKESVSPKDTSFSMKAWSPEDNDKK